MKLTIGTATYRDYHGVYFTLQSLRLHHGTDAELIVVDNDPSGSHSADLRSLCSQAGAKYVPMGSPVGTAAPRDRIFAEASGDVVLCLDSHVLLAPGSLDVLLDHFDKNSETRDLISGPMLADDGRVYATHFADEWRGQMWGTWARDDAGLNSGRSFEIPAMGLGVFACRKDAWPGFNDKFRGFGGEEWYVHEKVRRGRGRCLCLPGFKWLHRFARPDGVPYSPHLTLRNKVRNYILGLSELGISLDRCREHFVGGNFMPASEWDSIEEEVLGHPALRELASKVGRADRVEGDPRTANVKLPCDLLVVNAGPSANELYNALAMHAHKSSRYVAIPDTERFGERGPGGGPGLLPAVRRFLSERKHWGVFKHHATGSGLTILSCDPADRHKLPGMIAQGTNFAKALAAHVADGMKTVEKDAYEKRIGLCLTCEFRNDERCGKCGCFIAEKAKWRSSECPVGIWTKET